MQNLRTVQHMRAIPRDSKDKMGSYLSLFEKYATANNWDTTLWVAYLGALFKWGTIDVYDRLPNENAVNYDKLKEALLKNFGVTERGFHQKWHFRRPEKSETFIQFSSRLNSCLNKWLTLAKVKMTYEVVCDFMVHYQFLETCNR